MFRNYPVRKVVGEGWETKQPLPRILHRFRASLREMNWRYQVLALLIGHPEDPHLLSFQKDPSPVREPAVLSELISRGHEYLDAINRSPNRKLCARLVLIYERQLAKWLSIQRSLPSQLHSRRQSRTSNTSENVTSEKTAGGRTPPTVRRAATISNRLHA